MGSDPIFLFSTASRSRCILTTRKYIVITDKSADARCSTRIRDLTRYYVVLTAPPKTPAIRDARYDIRRSAVRVRHADSVQRWGRPPFALCTDRSGVRPQLVQLAAHDRSEALEAEHAATPEPRESMEARL